MEHPLVWIDEEIELIKIHFPHRKNALLVPKLREINLKNGRDIHRTESAIAHKAHLLGLVKSAYYRRQERIQRINKAEKEKKLIKFQDREKQKILMTMTEKRIKEMEKYER